MEQNRPHTPKNREKSRFLAVPFLKQKWNKSGTFIKKWNKSGTFL